MEDINVTWTQRWLQLFLLTLCYVFGELGHFLIGVTSRDVARDIHYGDKACFASANETSDYCSQLNHSSCLAADSQCRLDYTGLGLDYQLLAGPAFIAVFTVSGVAIGALADSEKSHFLAHRTRLLGAAVCLFSCSTTLMAAATEYWHLVVLRMILAAGEAACSPIGVSLISDLFPASTRGMAAGIFHWGVYFGFGASYLLGVYVTKLNLLGLKWRSCYLIAGIPGFILGIALMTIKDVRVKHRSRKAKKKNAEHADGSQEEMKSLANSSADYEIKNDGETSNSCSKVKQIAAAFSTLTMILLFVASAFRHSAGFTFAYNARLFFLTYHPETDVGAWLAVCAIVGGAAGVFCGGAASDWLLKKLASPEDASRGAKARLWVLAGSMFIATPLAVGVLELDPPYSFYSLFVYYFFAETWLGIVFVVVVELVPAATKTGVLGVFLFLMNNIGGNVPVLVDPLSKLIGYREALLVFHPTFVLTSGTIFFLASLSIKKRQHGSNPSPSMTSKPQNT